MIDCIYIHDPEPVPADLMAPQWSPSPDDESVLVIVGWQPVCAVDAETWYDGSDVPDDLIAAHPFQWFEGHR